MAKAQTPTAGEFQVLTLEEHAKLRQEYTAALKLVEGRRRAWYSAHKKGQLPAVRSDIEKAIGERAQELANGHAVALFRASAAVDADETPLLIEHGALKSLLEALDRPEIINATMHAAALRWHEDHAAEDLALDREALLTGLRFQALELRRLARHAQAGAFVPYLPTFPMARWFGRNMVDVDWGRDPLREPREAALAAGIVTEAEIKKVQNV